MLISSESRSLWPLYTHYGHLWYRLQMMAVPHLLTQRIECRAGLQSVGLRQSQRRLGSAVDRLSPNSVEIGRQGRVAAVGKHASDLLRQDSL
jgi:hypothetical protein